MSVMIRRSIGLSQRSSDAWKAAGGWFPMRTRNTDACLKMAGVRGTNAKPIINLGDTTFTPTPSDLLGHGITGTLYNHGDVIRCLIRPGAARKRLGEFMPPDPREGYLGPQEYTWIKAPGQGGQGKTKLDTVEAIATEIPEYWDMQIHVEGQEYRVITVNLKVVQVSKRFGDDDNRRYEWIGVTSAPSSVKEAAREGARRLDGPTIIGWDIIHKEGSPNRTYILEGNSSPGVNVDTAKRIVNEIEGVPYD